MVHPWRHWRSPPPIYRRRRGHGRLAGSRPGRLLGPARGYQAAGRWFRYVATTVTVPPRTLPYPNGGSAFIGLNGRYPALIGAGFDLDPAGI